MLAQAYKESAHGVFALELSVHEPQSHLTTANAESYALREAFIKIHSSGSWLRHMKKALAVCLRWNFLPTDHEKAS